MLNQATSLLSDIDFVVYIISPSNIVLHPPFSQIRFQELLWLLMLLQAGSSAQIRYLMWLVYYPAGPRVLQLRTYSFSFLLILHALSYYLAGINDKWSSILKKRG